MARKRKTTKQPEGIPFIPLSWQAFIARRIVDSTGFICLAIGLFLAASITTYNHIDPSWNTSTANGAAFIYNIAGRPGAYVADAFVQTIGFASLTLAIVFIVWGARLLARQKIRPISLRASVMVITSFIAAIALARIPAGDANIIQPYLGGSLGSLALDQIAALTHPYIPSYNHSLISALAGITALGLVLYACAVTKEEIISFSRFIWWAARMAAHYVTYAIQSAYVWVLHFADPELAKHIKDKPARVIKPKKQRAKKKETVNTPKDIAPEPGPTEQAAATATKTSAPKVANSKPPKHRSSMSGYALKDMEWEFPDVDLLQDPPADHGADMLDEDELRENAEKLQNVLADFNVNGEIVSIHPGPVVTLYELEPAPGTKTSRVIGLSDDIARSMSAISVRCAVVPGRNVIGIELPNHSRQTVYLKELIESPTVHKTAAKLPLILGKDIGGHPIIGDLTKMPHLLVAGTTGSGKSVAVNTMIMSLVYRMPPEKCRFIMIDPKMLELSVYDDIPHLLSPVVTEPGKAVVALKWVVQEMENRYRAMAKLGVRNIEGYNARLKQASKNGETLMRKVQTGFDSDTGKPIYEDQPMDTTEMPYIVVIVDEFADLMLVAGKDVEGAVQRLAQMARASGIHLIMATQRPSVDVITGVIKANFPSRISFNVTSKVDSRTIIGEGGAEQLLGMGDMLYMEGGGRIQRVHGPFVSDDEVENVVTHLKSQSDPSYIEDVTDGGGLGDSEIMDAIFGDRAGGNDGDKVDELYDEAVAIVAREQKASTSFLQRCLQIGYNRAARIIEEMEKQGVISPATATGKRDVLISDFSDV